MFILFFCANKRFRILTQLLILSDLSQIAFIIIVARSIIQRGNFNFCSGLINTTLSLILSHLFLCRIFFMTVYASNKALFTGFKK